MAISFTIYANKKFDILRRHGCIITREDVRDAVNNAIGTEVVGQSLFFAEKNIDQGCAVRVAYRAEAGVARVITFYPILHNDESRK